MSERMLGWVKLQAWAAGTGLALAYLVSQFPIGEFAVIYGRF